MFVLVHVYLCYASHTYIEHAPFLGPTGVWLPDGAWPRRLPHTIAPITLFRFSAQKQVPALHCWGKYTQFTYGRIHWPSILFFLAGAARQPLFSVFLSRFYLSMYLCISVYLTTYMFVRRFSPLQTAAAAGRPAAIWRVRPDCGCG